MGKAKQTARKSEESVKRRAGPPIYKRAGLHLPSSRYTKKIKEGLRGNHKVAKLTPVATVAYLEYMATLLLKGAAKHVGEKKNIRPEHLHAALNEQDSPVYGVFPKIVTGLR